jgi:hypothetical protein
MPREARKSLQSLIFRSVPLVVSIPIAAFRDRFWINPRPTCVCVCETREKFGERTKHDNRMQLTPRKMRVYQSGYQHVCVNWRKVKSGWARVARGGYQKLKRDISDGRTKSTRTIGDRKQ